MADEFQRIDAYCDTVPRASATTEQIGPFTLFVGRSGRSFDARPTAGNASPADRDDFDRVLARQRYSVRILPADDPALRSADRALSASSGRRNRGAGSAARVGESRHP